jgi:protein involved in polysaccharide export with SLBB domain
MQILSTGLRQSLLSWRRLSRVAFGLVFLVGCGPAALAQMPTPSLEQLQQLQQQRTGSATTTPPSVSNRETILEPTAPPAVLPTSPLETLLSSRAGLPLKQFGYEQLGVGRAVNLPQVGAVQDDYVLGVGDEVVLTLRGQENSEYRTEVNRDGNVTFPKLNPVAAAGRSFGQLRQDLQATIRRAYVSTEGFVTIGKIRQISVQVSGEVGSPGMRTLNGLSTVADAIFVSGGISKSGSLRNIRVLRGNRELAVDLYGLLVGGVQSRNITLTNGDKIVVPPIGGTVAVAGDARRSAIYELPSGRSSISVREAVALAAGTMVPGSYSISLLRTTADGRRQFVDITNAPATAVSSGEVLFVKTAVNISVNQVTLQGSARAPGLFALNRYPTLHELLPSVDALSADAYMLMGVIDRTDPATLQRTIIPFSPLAVVQGRSNVTLVSNDVVHILTKEQMRELLPQTLQKQEQRIARVNSITSSASSAVQSRAAADISTGNIFGDTTQNTTGSGTQSITGDAQNMAANGGADRLSEAASALGQATQLRNAVSQSADGLQTRRPVKPAAEKPAAEIEGMSSEDIDYFGRVLSIYRVNIGGAVYNPGYYLVAPGSSLADVVMAAGGLTGDVDLSTLELTSTSMDNQTGASTTTRKRFAASPEALKNYVVKPLDDVFFRQVYSDAETGAFIALKGEVRNPGTYSILRNERLSSIIERAGGLTPQAYPYGAVFTRLSVAERERTENTRSANDIRSQILNAVARPASSGQSPLTGDALSAISALLNQIESRPTVGRISVIPDPSYLHDNPSSDILVESGDTLVIPKVPSTVTVLGEVLQPGTFVWDKSEDVSDYVDRAGGPSEFADTSRIIVILPDGSARSAGMSWLSIGMRDDVPPGSTVVVFRDVSSLSTHQLIVEVTSIMSALASTAAAMAVLSKY